MYLELGTYGDQGPRNALAAVGKVRDIREPHVLRRNFEEICGYRFCCRALVHHVPRVEEDKDRDGTSEASRRDSLRLLRHRSIECGVTAI